MRAILLGIMLMALAGCAPTIARVETKEVKVPVSVPCIKKSSIPIEPISRFSAVPAMSPVDEQVRVLLIDRETMNLYSKRLRAALEACVITDATNSADLAPSPVKP